MKAVNILHSRVFEFEVFWKRFNIQIEAIHRLVQIWWKQSEHSSTDTIRTSSQNEAFQLQAQQRKTEHETTMIASIVSTQSQKLFDTNELSIENDILIFSCQAQEQSTSFTCEKKWIQSQLKRVLKNLWMNIVLQETDELFKLILTQLQFQLIEERWNMKAIQVWIVQQHRTNIETHIFSNTKTHFNRFSLFWILNMRMKTSSREIWFRYWIQIWRLWTIWQSAKFNTKQTKQSSRLNIKTHCEMFFNRFIS